MKTLNKGGPEGKKGARVGGAWRGSAHIALEMGKTKWVGRGTWILWDVEDLDHP